MSRGEPLAPRPDRFFQIIVTTGLPCKRDLEGDGRDRYGTRGADSGLPTTARRLEELCKSDSLALATSAERWPDYS
jgi:hypothetical protein